MAPVQRHLVLNLSQYSAETLRACSWFGSPDSELTVRANCRASMQGGMIVLLFSTEFGAGW